MGWNEPDLYNQPEHFGVRIVGVVEWDYECYQFNMTVVWVDALDQFYMGDDSGCSCPSPFEDSTSAEDLGMPMTKHEVAAALQKGAEDTQQRSYMSDEDKEMVKASVVSLIEKVMNYKGDNG
jgi:hypothetical protein